MIGKSCGEECGRLHVHSHCARRAQVVLEALVVLPDASVSGVDGACPVVEPRIANRGADCSLQHEGGQGRHLWRVVVVGRTFAADACQRQDEVPHAHLGRDCSAFAQEEAGAGVDGSEQVHDDGRIRRAHSEVNHRNAISRSHAHISLVGGRRDAEVLTEDVHVVVEIGQQHQL